MIGSGFRKDIKKVRQPLQRVVNSISPLKNKDLFSILENAMKKKKKQPRFNLKECLLESEQEKLSSKEAYMWKKSFYHGYFKC